MCACTKLENHSGTHLTATIVQGKEGRKATFSVSMYKSDLLEKAQYLQCRLYCDFSHLSAAQQMLSWLP